ncbi:MAG: tail fiber domain-containing protein [Lachnospiraceae bacterium]|nr:tail fiber domain-containing protein [Lachnospiraceae bacterium]
MNIKLDKISNTIDQPDVWLCHRNYKKICPLSPITDLKVYVAANSYDEVTFTFHKENNGEIFPYWEEIKNLKVIYVENFGYFEIAVDKDAKEDTIKTITGISIETELAQIILRNLSINGEYDLNKEDNFTTENGKTSYKPTVLYDENDTSHSLIHRVLSKAPHWSVGHIDSQITENDVKVSTSDVKRKFEFDNTSIYDALQEIATELDLVFTFDTTKRLVNMYDLNTIGSDTTIYVNKENLANQFTCSGNKDSIKNRFKILGGDDIITSYVSVVNPNGTQYIDFYSDDQKADMSKELVEKLHVYDELYEANREAYQEASATLYEKIDKVNQLKYSLAPTQEKTSTTAEAEIQKLTSANIGSVPVSQINQLYKKGADKAVLTIAQILVDYRYTVTIESSVYDSSAKTWTGKFKAVNESNPSDVAKSPNDIILNIIEDEKEDLQNKINKIIGDVNFEDETLDSLKETLKHYSLSYLESYQAMYKECTTVLLEQGYGIVTSEFYPLYEEYWQKQKACEEEIAIRKGEIEAAQDELDSAQNAVNAYHQLLNFENFIGETLYKELSCYIREDTYENSNYISDGLSDAECIENAKKLVEAATKELYKSSTFQYTYTASLNNLFNNPNFEPFYNQFDLFNWIHAEVDERHILLRLIGVTFDFANTSQIEVEFSEQVKNADGLTDIESILSQAKSMATSYSSTAKQAAQGSQSYTDFKTLKEEGLNSALMNIKNSNNEEVVIDSCGINCRSKDVNDTYDGCQMRITGKNLVMTDDDWKTARLAIGEGIFEGQKKYGIWCDILMGNIIAGETLLISNRHQTFIVDKDGIIVNNMKLDMYSEDQKHRILIDPALKSMFNIYNEEEQVFFIDQNGNVSMYGNLYVNNNNMYCNIDMNSDNIIEIGVGEGKTDLQKIEIPWERVPYGLNVTDYALDYHQNWGDYGTDIKNKYFEQRKLCIKNGEIYLLYNKKIKKWDKNSTWKTIHDITNEYSKTDRDNKFYFINTNRIDNNLYIISEGDKFNNLNMWVYDIDADECVCLFNSVGSNDSSIEIDYWDYRNSYLLDNILYVYTSYYTQGMVCYGDITAITADTTYKKLNLNTFNKNNIINVGILEHNEKVYLINLVKTNNNFTLQLVMVKDFKTQTIQFISEFNYQNMGSSNDVANGGQVYVYTNFTIVNEDIYIIINQYNKINKKMFVFNESDGDLKEINNLPDSFISSVGLYPEGTVMFYDNEKLHLISCFVNNVTRVETNKYRYYYSDALSIAYMQHFVTDLKGNILSTNKNFKELDNGRDFNMSSQHSFVKLNNIIYSLNTACAFYTSYTTPNATIKKLDTNNKDNNWELVLTLPERMKVLCFVESDSENSLYFIGTNTYANLTNISFGQMLNSPDVYATLWEYNLKTNVLTDLLNTEGDTSLRYGLPNIGLYGFYSSELKKLVYYRATTTTVDIETRTSVVTNQRATAFISNNIYDGDSLYSIAEDNGTTCLYRLNKASSSLTKLATILDMYSTGLGFSIAKYKDNIHIFYSRNGCLAKERFVYNLKTEELEKKEDMFYSDGLHMPDKEQNYSTCFLPAIATDNGIHFFIGHNQIDGLNGNGGYKHFLYKDESDDSNVELENPLGKKIFYIDNQGNGYFYGNIYANDGIFKGDIIARSLTLGSNVNIDMSHVEGLNDTLDGVVNDLNGKIDGIVDGLGGTINGINSDLSNVIYKGDIITETIDEGNGVIKTITKVPKSGGGYTENTTYTSADGNYILTNVGVGGDDSGHYCIISTDGLLEAKNAKIDGQINATQGYIGKWAIGEDGVFSIDFNTSDSGIKMLSDGQILSKGTGYSEQMYARLYSGKWIFGLGDSFNTEGKRYSDLSVDGLYLCSTESLKSNISRYLFAVDTINDKISISSQSNNNALEIINNVGNCIYITNKEPSYENAAFRAKIVCAEGTTTESEGFDPFRQEGYITMFGEATKGRIVLRADAGSNTTSDDGTIPNFTDSAVGTHLYRWGEGYFEELTSSKALNVTSDKKKKNHISYIDKKTALNFVNALMPAMFTMKDNTNQRKHFGFYAQEVAKLAKNMNLGDLSLYNARWIKDGTDYNYSEEADDKELDWSLKYDEFIPLLVSSIQELTKCNEEKEKKIEELSDTVTLLANEINQLKEELKKMKN